MFRSILSLLILNVSNVIGTDTGLDPLDFYKDEGHGMPIWVGNDKWKKRLTMITVNSLLVKKIINIPNTVPLYPLSIASYVDITPYCWIISIYNSNNVDSKKSAEDQGTFLTLFPYS